MTHSAALSRSAKLKLRMTVVVRQVLHLLLGRCVYTMHSGVARGLKRRYGYGFRLTRQVTPEEVFLKSRDYGGKTIYDVGGYIGLTTMFFALAAGESGQVITFEPNPANCAELSANLELNHLQNVTVLPIAVGDAPGYFTMLVDPIFASRGSLSPEFQRRMFNQYARPIEVKVDSLDHLVQQQRLPVPDFVKIDVEGFEQQVLNGMLHTIQQYQPDLFIEVHGVLQRDLVAWLAAHHYGVYRVESQAIIEPEHVPNVRGGHLFCSGQPMTE